ncbi:MAG: Acryloyl-CoA reductase electron transfer subunit gamma [Planctomycetes bacterium ADurb.Bin412]|nr:MAG: Acryloyl-CoA reductase electron transfer subunit gamma [Planctomycetes bacterium ADurb.Bin412]
MPYDCVVLVKQVPDTKAVTGKAMNDDGTVNRAALPAIFNPEDLNALELALSIREKHGGTVTIMTMGLPSACEVLREGLYRGADRAILVTDRRCAASDTLATSYILSCAVRKLKYDFVLCGRQAIDGDTAQVGPQLAEKLNIPQITYVEELIALQGREVTVRRNIGAGWEKIQGRLPILLTVMETANEPRPAGAKWLMKYKKAKSPAELRKAGAGEAEVKALQEKGLLIEEWNLDDVAADLQWCGRDGSPTKVHRIQSVVLTATEQKDIDPSEEGIRAMVHELIEDHTIG